MEYRFSTSSVKGRLLPINYKGGEQILKPLLSILAYDLVEGQISFDRSVVDIHCMIPMEWGQKPGMRFLIPIMGPKASYEI